MGRKVALFAACVAGTMLLIVPSAMAFSISVTSIDPTSARANATVQCTIGGSFGTGLLDGTPQFELVKDATTIAGSTRSFNGTSAVVDFALPGSSPLGFYTVHAAQWHPPFDYEASMADGFQMMAPAPVITSTNPASVVAGSGDLTLTVYGNYFISSTIPFPRHSHVLFNGVDVPTTYNSTTVLTATIPAVALATAGTAQLTVHNPSIFAIDPGAYSLPYAFTITSPAPVLTSLSPTSVWAGYVRNDIVLTVNGGNFLAGAHIFLGDGEKTGTTFVNASQLTVPLVAADISTPTTLTVSVKNPPFPPGTPSAGALLLPVQAETTDPVVTINGADSGWHNVAVPLAFSATDTQSGVQAVQFRCPPAVPSWTNEVTYTVPTTTQGSVIVEAQALDWCNRVGTTSATVNIDTTQPTTDALNAVSVKRNKTAKLKFRITEPTNLSPTAQVVLKVKAVKGGRTVKTKTIPDATMNSVRMYSFKVTFKKGSYKWYVYATDLAGNTQANVANAKFTVK